MLLLPVEQFPHFRQHRKCPQYSECHLLIGVKTMSGNYTIRLLDTYKLVGIDFLSCLVPIKQLGIETLPFPVLYIYIPYLFPEFLLIIIISGICLDASFNIKDRVKLFQINSLFKCPNRKVSCGRTPSILLYSPDNVSLPSRI